MATPRIVPPIDYLRQASPSSLQSFELSRLNHAANLRREIAALIDQWIQESSEALLARWVLDLRDSPHPSTLSAPDLFRSLLDPAPPQPPNSQPTPTDSLQAPPRFADSRQPIAARVDRKSQKHRSTA